jgi:hypothetical protein
VYNVCFMGMSTPYFRTKLTLEGSQTACCIVRLNCPKGHTDMLALLRPPHGGVAVEAGRIPVRALMHILEPDLEAESSPTDGLHLYSLTGLHAINRVITCSVTCNRNLAYGKV